MPTIGLCMIVKNEAGLVRRCLESARPLIDYVIVEDTGSTDGTPEAIEAWLAETGVPGKVIHEPWRDFAHNRTHALAEMRKIDAVDYVLMIDADDIVVMEPGFDPAAFKATLAHDALQVRVWLDQYSWLRPQLGSNRIAFTVKGVIHERVCADKDPLSIGMARGFHIRSGSKESARGKNPRKYLEDAAVLEKALAAEEDPYTAARYCFYLAQSYADAGEDRKALEYYQRRVEMDGWSQEVFCSLHRIAKLQEALGKPADAVIAAFLRAAEAGSDRAEPLYEAARRLLKQGRFEDAYQHAKAALARKPAEDALFLEPEIYNFRLLDLLSVAAFKTERWTVSAAACERLLGEGRTPPDQIERVQENAASAAVKRAEAWAGEDDPGGFRALLEAARAREEVGAAPSEILAAYDMASAAARNRAEALHGASRFCRSQGMFEHGYLYARQGLGIVRPQAAPGLEDWIYDYGLLDELMANAYWTGRYVESAQVCDRLLRENLMPADVRERIRRNRQALAGKLQEQQLGARPDDRRSRAAAGERIGRAAAKFRLPAQSPANGWSRKL
jgi:tetratricopeptide (TPR) repeat protein